MCDAKFPFVYSLTGISVTLIPGNRSFCSLIICTHSNEIFCAMVTDFVELYPSP